MTDSGVRGEAVLLNVAWSVCRFNYLLILFSSTALPKLQMIYNWTDSIDTLQNTLRVSNTNLYVEVYLGGRYATRGSLRVSWS